MENRLMGYVLSMLSVGIVALILLGATGAEAQERERVLDCLGEVDATWYEPLSDMEGQDIYIGGDERFNVPSNVYMIAKLSGWDDVANRVIVWIFYSPSTPNVTYWFPFSDTTLYENGTVMHPCGAFRVVGEGK